MALAGVSTLGVTFGYAAEETSGTKPTSFLELTRINSIGGITLETNTIDASALSDLVERSVAGRQGTSGGQWEIVVNATDETIAEWTTLIEEYNTAHEASKSMWFQVNSPSLAKAFYIVAEPPQSIPMPEISQNELMTYTITLAVSEYKGMDSKVAITPRSYS